MKTVGILGLVGVLALAGCSTQNRAAPPVSNAGVGYLMGNDGRARRTVSAEEGAVYFKQLCIERLNPQSLGFTQLSAGGTYAPSDVLVGTPEPGAQGRNSVCKVNIVLVGTAAENRDAIQREFGPIDGLLVGYQEGTTSEGVPVVAYDLLL